MKVAIVIGHDINEKGAFSKFLKMHEYTYHSEVAKSFNGIDIYRRTPGKSYKMKMVKLAEQINSKGYDLVVELHFNSFNGAANGVETISYPKSKSLEYGKLFCEMVSNKYSIKNRGAKEGIENGRGWWFLKLMNPPALILEPFFGDNEEAYKFKDTVEYASLICEWIQKIKKI